MKNKNIWLLPTDKESRLHFDDKLFLSTSLQISKNINSIVEGRNIYITSEKEIKMGDWYTIEFNGIPITKCISEEELISIEGRNDCKKIILTTDDQLIKDGVQEIDDEFLEWFVKNPSCERVEVEKGFPDGTSYGYNFIDYKIIIPEEEVLLQSSIDGEAIWGEAKQETLKEPINHPNSLSRSLNNRVVKKEEPKKDRTCTNNCSVVCGECQIFEPKQETLEEAAERLFGSIFGNTMSIDWAKDKAIELAKWQQEQIYNLIRELYDNEEITGFSKRAYAQCLDIVESFKKK